MRKLLWAVPIAAFFLNPGLACTDEPEFQYGAAEMRAAVEGDWSFTIGPYQILSRVSADGTLADTRLGPLGTIGTLTASRL
jgi:hypothetical protein